MNDKDSINIIFDQRVLKLTFLSITFHRLKKIYLLRIICFGVNYDVICTTTLVWIVLVTFIQSTLFL